MSPPDRSKGEYRSAQHEGCPVSPTDDERLAHVPIARAAPTRSLDILYAGTLPPHTGGSAIHCGDLLAALARRGHRVRAIAPLADAHRGNADSYAAANPMLRVQRITVPYDADSPDVAPTAAYREAEDAQMHAALAAAIAERRPDLIVAGRESFARHVPGVARTHRLPSVLLVQGTTTWGILRETIPPPMAEELLRGFRSFDRMIAVARHVAVAMRGLGFTDADAIENTVDTQRFRPQGKSERLLRTLRLRDDDIVVAHVSNLKPLKRSLDLVASAREALARDPRLVYVIVGSGNQCDELRAATRAGGIDARFRYAGWVDRNEVPDYLNLADIVVMPSQAEARALVYLEAQACGRVLLASDIAAAREVVEDGETGVLFETGDVADLTAKTLRLAGDAALRARIGARARAAALARPFATMVGEYEAAFASVASTGAPR
jgi:glycosyltransferase involved in cell wall biosynthesis